MANDEQRQRRREIRMLQQESVWMQKMLFALRKVEDVRDRLADLRDEEAEAWTLEVAGEDVALADLEDGIEARVKEVLDTVRERRGRLR